MQKNTNLPKLIMKNFVFKNDKDSRFFTKLITKLLVKLINFIDLPPLKTLFLKKAENKIRRTKFM